MRRLKKIPWEASWEMFRGFKLFAGIFFVKGVSPAFWKGIFLTRCIFGCWMSLVDEFSATTRFWRRSLFQNIPQIVGSGKPDKTGPK